MRRLLKFLKTAGLLLVLPLAIAGLIWAGATGLLGSWSIVVGIVSGVIWLGITIFLLIWYWLAPTNRFFTFVNEATAKIVVKGDAFSKALIQWEGYTFDLEWDVTDRGVEPWHPFGGLRFYGIWPVWGIYVYDFAWTGVTQDGRIDIHPKQRVDYIILRDDVYWTKVEAAEDIDLLPLDIELVLTIRIVNPYKALFRIENWLETVINRSRPSVRDVVTKDKYENWIKVPEDMANRIYAGLTNRGLIAEFADRYGVEIRKIEVKEINPPSEYRKATLQKWQAERDREKILVEADAEAKKRERVAEGEARRLEVEWSKIREFGDLGQLVRALETLEKSPEKGAKWVIPLPGMADLFSRVFPGRPPETLSKEEIIRVIQEELRRRG